MVILNNAKGIAIGIIAASIFSGSAFAQTTYTTEQAEAGKTTFQSQCAMCHGPTLEGGDAPGLVGADFRGNWGTAAGVHGYFSVAMPPQSPGGLGEEAYLNIAAYIMQMNGIPAGDAPADTSSLAGVDLVAMASAAAAPTAEAAAPAETTATPATTVPQAFTFGKNLPMVQAAAPAAAPAAPTVPQAFTFGKELPVFDPNAPKPAAEPAPAPAPAPTAAPAADAAPAPGSAAANP